ncbi:MAG: hypothetical protein HQL11_06850, partial [Candidatus Omnitrophica bacterium]|nr:hypothetical protein [Candidatus Omnitrophota bacterium]
VFCWVLVVPWHWAAYASAPERFMSGFVRKHWIERTMRAVEGHSGNHFYYLRGLINKHHPWVLLEVPAAGWLLWRVLSGRGRSSEVLVISWIAVVLGVFTFAVQTKLRWYVLPMYPALALGVGAMFSGWWFRGWPVWPIKAAGVILLVLWIPLADIYIQDYAPGIKELSDAVRSEVPAGQRVYLYEFH